MKKTNFGFLALVLIALSCKKGSSATEEPTKYMSLSAGSTWTYETNNNLTATATTNIVTSTIRDSVINSKTYHVFTNSNGAANDYYNITGNDYYTFRNLGALGNTTVENIYLKDNAAVGINWSQTVNITVSGLPSAVPVTFTNTIAEKNISRTVSSIAYTNVIHVTTGIAVAGLPPGSLTTDIQSYYAAKVGLIESKYKINLPLAGINVDQSTILKTSSIK